MAVWHKPHEGSPSVGVLVPIRVVYKPKRHENNTVFMTNGYFDGNEWLINVDNEFKTQFKAEDVNHFKMMEWCDVTETDINNGAAIKLAKFIQKLGYKVPFGKDDYEAAGYNKCLREIKNALVTYCNE